MQNKKKPIMNKSTKVLLVDDPRNLYTNFWDSKWFTNVAVCCSFSFLTEILIFNDVAQTWFSGEKKKRRKQHKTIKISRKKALWEQFCLGCEWEFFRVRCEKEHDERIYT